MEWKNLINIKRFTPTQAVFEKIGKPLFRFEDRPVYYMGNGFLLIYTSRKFYIENLERIEYDDVGEYIIDISFFKNKPELLRKMIISEHDYEFGEDILGTSFEIVDGINIGDTFEKVQKIGRENYSSMKIYNEGESRYYKKGLDKFVFGHNWIRWNNVELFFFGKSKKTMLSAFSYIIED